mgnify:CR=1 FL=1
MSFESPHLSDPSQERNKHFENFISQELPRQHQRCTESLRHIGLLEVIPAGDDTMNGLVFEIQEGITAFNGEQFALPSPEAIAKYWKQHQEVIAPKLEQGFTRLCIIPFGYPLNLIIEKTKAVIVTHAKRGKLLAADGTKLDCDLENPLQAWEDLKGSDESGDLVYNVTKFDQTHHEGKTKQEILTDHTEPFPGFHVLLLPQNLIIPRQGNAETTGNRKALETNKNPHEHLKTIQTDPPYAHETGMTPEDDLTLMALHLHETNTVINDYQDNKTAINFLTGSYHKKSGYVPYLVWDRDDRRAYLLGNVPSFQRGGFGCRPAVGRIKT